MLTQEEKNNGNRLLAGFIDMQVIDNEIDTPFRPNLNCFRENELRFDSEWGWLMFVVEKIETTNIIEIFALECCVHKYNGTIGDHNPVIIWEQGESKMEAVWRACVEFVKAHNKNTNQK